MAKKRPKDVDLKYPGTPPACRGVCLLLWGRPEDADLHLIMSHVALTYHIVIGTYKRKPVIEQNHEKELYKYMYDFLTKRKVFVRRIGGMPDHVHILCDIPPTIAVADIIKIVKSESSKFMRVNPHFPYWEQWAEKYGAFSVDASLREVRRKYIMNQREHHQRQNFSDEYCNLLMENGLSCVDEPILGD